MDNDEKFYARCMKCRKQVEIKDPKGSVTKNRMMIVKGVCPVCNTNVCRILGKENKSVGEEGSEAQASDHP